MSSLPAAGGFVVAATLTTKALVMTLAGQAGAAAAPPAGPGCGPVTGTVHRTRLTGRSRSRPLPRAERARQCRQTFGLWDAGDYLACPVRMSP